MEFQEKSNFKILFLEYFYLYKKNMKKSTLILSYIVFGIMQIQAQTIVNISSDNQTYQVLDLTANEKITWGGYSEIGLPAKSDKDGKLNTKAILIAVGNNNAYDGKTYAAKVCDNSTDGGFDDWYLPAKDEAALIYLNIDKFSWGSLTLWTSTEASGTQAVSLYTYNGTWYNVSNVDSYNMVCMRKVE